MAEPRKDVAPRTEIARLLKEAAGGKAVPVYLFVGESVDTAKAGQSLAEVLLPESNRSLNLEAYDGRTTPFTRILDSVRTPGLFAGRKVVWIRETTLFLSGAKKGELAKAMMKSWSASRARDAAEKLATLAALAGWANDDFLSMDWTAATKTKLKEIFGDAVGQDRAEDLKAIHQVVIERDIRLADFRDEGATLQEYLDGAPPSDVVLIFTAPTVDARKKVVKRVKEVGVFVEFQVERERSGAISRAGAQEIVREVLGEFGKKLEGAAFDQILQRAGRDVAVLRSELEKLCLSVGERPTIRETDVRAALLDNAESWIFDFTGGLSNRNLEQALPVLRGLLGQGEPPLRLLGMIARELRLLLAARECLEGPLRDAWRGGMSYGAFQTRVLPRIDDATHGVFGKSHPFVVYRRMQDAARVDVPRLRRALVDLADLDLRFKSTRADPALLLERFVVGWCR